MVEDPRRSEPPFFGPACQNGKMEPGGVDNRIMKGTFKGEYRGSIRISRFWVSKIRDTILGFPMISTIIYCGLYWGPYFGTREMNGDDKTKMSFAKLWFRV